MAQLILNSIPSVMPPLSSPHLNPCTRDYYYRGWIEQWWSGPRLGLIPQIPSQGNINGNPPTTTTSTSPPLVIPAPITPPPILGHNPHCQSCPIGYQRDIYGNCVASGAQTCPTGYQRDIYGNCVANGAQTCPTGYQRDIYDNCVLVSIQ